MLAHYYDRAFNVRYYVNNKMSIYDIDNNGITTILKVNNERI